MKPYYIYFICILINFWGCSSDGNCGGEIIIRNIEDSGKQTMFLYWQSKENAKVYCLVNTTSDKIITYTIRTDHFQLPDSGNVVETDLFTLYPGQEIALRSNVKYDYNYGNYDSVTNMKIVGCVEN